VGFSPHHFSEVFKLRDSEGQPYVLIGGQAVNYWAEKYLSSEPELKALQPFTSKDIDFKGNRDDVQRIAKQLDSSPGYPPKVAMTALAGIIPIKIGGDESFIEVVRHIPGISSSKETPAVEARLQHKVIRLLDPVSLLVSKLELVATVSQAGRQDVQHLKILVPCVRAFLREVLQEVETDELPARDWLNLVNQVLKQTTSRRALKIGHKYQINWSAILPLAAIAQSKDKKIQRFHKLQLQQ